MCSNLIGFRSIQVRPACAILAAILATPLASLADGTLTGNCWVPKVKGRAGDYLALYEWNIWLSRDATGYTGQSFRVGLPPQPNQAYYTFTAPGGAYSLYLDEPMFWGRPTVVSGVSIPSSGTVNLNVEIPTDYSCAFGGNSGPWGDDPWTSWSSVWYQTFVATGTSITGVDFKLAGTNATRMLVSIHSDNGGNITTWPQVGISRSKGGLGPLGDQWLRFRSNEIPTVPGQRYALKLTGQSGNPNNEYAIFRRTENGQGYAQGQAYNSAGTAQNFDLYAIVFSDNDGTVVPYCAIEWDGGDLAGWAGVWTQEIKAVGNSLAGATLYYAAPDWHMPGTMRVRTGSPTGLQVGPAKTAWSASMAAESAFFSASWNPGEVPLTPGQVYYLEVSSTGFNPHRFTSGVNAYPHGQAWQSYTVGYPNVDLHMQVVEYANAVPPAIQRSPASFTREIVRRSSLTNDAFTIRNSGGGVLYYTISDDANWLSVDPAEGFSINETDSISIIYDTASLAVGPHTGTITISAPGATNPAETVTVYLTVTPPPLAPCDFDQDHDVDQADFGRFQRCYSGPGVPQPDSNCTGADLEQDNDVDSGDFSLFLGCLSGPGAVADTLCAG